MKKIIFCFFCFFSLSNFLLTANAHTINSNANDPEAKKLLDRVSQSMKKIHHFTAHFLLTVEDATHKAMGNKQGIFYSKASEYKVSIAPNQEIFSDGKTIYTYDKTTQEIQITTIDPNQATLSPEKLFTNFYDKDFSYKLNAKKSIKGNVVDEIELIPKDTKKPFSKVLLHLDMKRRIPISATIFDKSGLTYTYVITKFDKVSPIENISFNKNKYPNAQIVDLR